MLRPPVFLILHSFPEGIGKQSLCQSASLPTAGRSVINKDTEKGEYALATQERHSYQRHPYSPTLCRIIFKEIKSHPHEMATYPALAQGKPVSYASVRDGEVIMTATE